MQRLPEHGPCFVCGRQNSCGMGVTWYAREDGSIFTEVTLTEVQQGPPGMAHGGASAALLDEAMGAAVWRAGFRAAAVNLNTTYQKPVPLGVKIQVTGRFIEKNEKRLFALGEIRLPDGTVAVIGKGTYVEAPHMFSELTSQFEVWQS
ncbi:MAG: hypothetical protein CVU38_00950 [Chloroflexi bacterium HGW-Chloroflexi-1]|nr:MAG: hypothetical protein CVU38_00950 [Chloroflexi bacterium HGW-Chloroflexi-1]